MVDNQVDQTTGTVRMKAEFPNANLQLWPGQFVNVRILIQTLQQVVVIPTQAVQRGPSGAFAYVVQQDQRVGLRPVTLTLQNETQAVVAKGIEAGEQVVTTGFCPPQGRLARRALRARGAGHRRRQEIAGRLGRARRRCARRAPPISRNSAPASSAAASAIASRPTRRNFRRVARPPPGSGKAAGSGKPREADASSKGGGSSTQ